MKNESRLAIWGMLPLGLIGLGTPAQAGDPGVYSRDAVVFGRTYSEWSAAWQQWALSMPAKKHPLFDTADCNEGQSGPVFFLGGRFCAPDVNPQNPKCKSRPAVRSCAVPAGKAIYLPVLNTECLDGESKANLCLDPDGKNAGPFPAEMRLAIAKHIDLTTGLQATLDGKGIGGNLKRNFRVQSAVYTVGVPEGNLLQVLGEDVIVPGTYWGVDEGMYLMLEPFKKGSTHTLNFKGSFPQYNFDLDFTYKLTVQ